MVIGLRESKRDVENSFLKMATSMLATGLMMCRMVWDNYADSKIKPKRLIGTMVRLTLQLK